MILHKPFLSLRISAKCKSHVLYKYERNEGRWNLNNKICVGPFK